MQYGDRIARRMKLHDLRILMAVVQAGSMNKAAVRLNTRQSAISRSIADLERAHFPIRAGDRLRFAPIGTSEFAALRGGLL